jgi:hypothetical protein
MRKKPRMSLVLRMAKPVSANTLFPPRRKPSGVKSGRSPQCGSSRDETVGLAPQSWTNFISEGVGSFMSMFKNKHRFLENGDEYLKNAKETICNCSNVHEKNCSKVHEKYELL